MGELLKFRKPDSRARGEGQTLCRTGFHKWRIENARHFDVKQGRLVTQLRCERCGATRTELR